MSQTVIWGPVETKILRGKLLEADFSGQQRVENAYTPGLWYPPVVYTRVLYTWVCDTHLQR